VLLHRALKTILLALALTLASHSLCAQTPTTIQQSASRLDANIRCDSATGVGATGTLTLLNPGPGLSDYITYLHVTVEATGTISAASPIAITSTNISGTAPTFGSINLIASTIGAVLGPGPMNFPGGGLKANSNTAPTFAVATVTNGTSRLTACYFIAP
jgi:hypothetical protein